MKFSSLAGLLAIPVLLIGCNSLDNPLRGLFGSGRDGRVFNARTGNYEWPEDQNKPPVKSQKTAQIGAAIAAAATPAPASDGRVYDAQKREWVDAPTTYDGPNSGKPKPKPAATAKPAPGATPAPVILAAAPPQPPRPQRATGVYDPHTGKIEWQDGGGGTMPAPTPVPESKKHWYWPF